MFLYNKQDYFLGGKLMAKNAKVLAISSLAALSLSITACSQYVATPDGENILSFGDGITVTADELLSNRIEFDSVTCSDFDCKCQFSKLF